MKKQRAALLPGLATILCVAAPVWAAGTRISIDPGPSVISDEERALEPDPSAGVEHGVVLVRESHLNDAYGANTEYQTHVRAKIFSNDARDLANVEISLGSSDKLTGWWGKTLLPDGRVLGLEEQELVEQQLARVGSWSVRELKGALPGVVPGCVIDYGYTIKSEAPSSLRRIVLQRRWPVREFRYRWKPADYLPSAYRVYAAEGLDVEVTRDRHSVLVVGLDLPPVPHEPMMPPDHEVRAAVVLYYLRQGTGVKHFWRDHCKQIARLSRTPFSDDVVERAVAGIATGSDAPLEEQLQAGYDWIAANVDNPLLLRGGRTVGRSVTSVGSIEPLDKVFLQVARRLGAEAHVVLAADRRKRFWDVDLADTSQLEVGLVAVRPPDAPVDQTLVVDPSSGLPFGEIPWWVSGTDGVLATSSGAQLIFLPPSGAPSNLTMAVVELRFSDDGSRLEAEWNSTSRGQAGLDRAQALTGRREISRRKRIDEHCGFGADVDVTVSDHQVLPSMVSKLSCTTERFVSVFDESIGRFNMMWTGPWMKRLPDLAPGERIHPVIFDYPRVDIVELTIDSPPGFRPLDAPEPTKLSSPYGNYQLAITRTSEGFKVERALALVPLKVPADEYDALLAFLEEIRRADGTRVEFSRVGGE